MHTEKEVMSYARKLAKQKGFSTVWAFLGDTLKMKSQKTFRFTEKKDTVCKCRGKGKEEYWKQAPFEGAEKVQRVFCTACCKFVARKDSGMMCS